MGYLALTRSHRPVRRRGLIAPARPARRKWPTSGGELPDLFLQPPKNTRLRLADRARRDAHLHRDVGGGMPLDRHPPERPPRPVLKFMPHRPQRALAQTGEVIWALE